MASSIDDNLPALSVTRTEALSSVNHGLSVGSESKPGTFIQIIPVLIRVLTLVS